MIMRNPSIFICLLLGMLFAISLPIGAADEVLTKYSFVPGEKLLFMEDLSTTSTGEAPLSLQSNGEADIVTVGGEKWLDLGNDAIITMPVTGQVDDLTLEFYVRISNPDSAPNFTISLLNEDKEFEAWVRVSADAADWGGNYGGNELPRNTMSHNLFDKDQTVPVALTVQKGRVKLFVNKILVMNIAGFSPILPNKITITAGEGMEDADLLGFKDFRIATLVPDIASELMNKGKYVSHGIRFDTGSSKVKDESYAVLKQIADVLNTNTDLKLTVVGHTDNTGNKQANQKLSLERAESVKQYLVTKFGVDASRLETAGKGDTEPIADNKMLEGRSNNRRVEFIKL